MRKRRLGCLWKSALVLVCVFLITQTPFIYHRYKLGRLAATIQQLNAQRNVSTDDPYTDYRGALHVHTSLGGHSTGTLAEVIQAARANALAQGGAQVTHAATATQALLALEDERPDLLVSDIGMPVTDGYALIRTVRAREAARGLARLPAIALTAYARPDDRAQALQAGYDAHIAKPVEPSELLAQLARLAKIRMSEG